MEKTRGCQLIPDSVLEFGNFVLTDVINNWARLWGIIHLLVVLRFILHNL
jgi:hypothetical protein